MQRIESEFYRNLNASVEPLARAGFGSPGLLPTGAIVLEVTGRKSGLTHNVPLLATLFGNLIIVSTVRRRSQWMKNLAVNPEVRYWMLGQAKEATAFVFAPGVEKPQQMPPAVSCLASAILPFATLYGVSFAILTPR